MMIFPVVSAFAGSFFAGIGIYALKTKKPMRFWSGSENISEEITDVKAYNRANAVLWIAFSAVFFISALIGFLGSEAAGWVMMAGCLAGIPALAVAYKKIYKRYSKK
ncbi:MAG: hypothetical protein IJV00_04465 [Clostridia bacterium]|nr:hypothetical protein [Clostridia bacterium]